MFCRGKRPAAHTAPGPKASRPPIGRLAPIVRTLWGQTPRSREHVRLLVFLFFAFVSSVLHIGKTKAFPCRPSGGRLALGPSAEWAAGQSSKKAPPPASLLPPEKRFLGKEPPFLSGGPGGCAPWCSFPRLSPEKAGPPAGSSPRGQRPPGGCGHPPLSSPPGGLPPTAGDPQPRQLLSRRSAHTPGPGPGT